MNHQKMVPYLVGAVAVAAVLSVFGVPLAALLPFAVLLACPLMMFFMMRGMGGMGGMSGMGSQEDHTGHGCEHDPTRHLEPSERRPPADTQR